MKYSRGEEIEWARSSLVGHWSTLVTPFDSEDIIDQAGLIRNIERIRNLGTNGIGCTWGMGEFWSLTNSERKHVMEIVSDHADGMLTGVHITHTSVKEMIDFAEFAEDLGFDILILGAPYFERIRLAIFSSNNPIIVLTLHDIAISAIIGEASTPKTRCPFC